MAVTALTEVGICNLALSRLGETAQLSGTTIAGVTSTSDVRAQQLQLWYPVCLDQMLTDYPWRWATTIAALTLVATNDGTQAWSRWTYQYTYPTTALMIRSVGALGDPKAMSVPNKYEILYDATLPFIYSDVPTAYAEYVVEVTNSAVYGVRPKFATALSALLAARIAVGISADQNKAQNAAREYIAEVLSAQRSDANESEDGEELDGSFVTVHRNG